jgi:hypothetical protein
MNKIVQIKIFNDILDQLFDYLEENFPFFKSDVILSRSTTEFIRKSNPRLVVEQFMGNVGPYEQEIFACDEHFFLNFENNLTQNLSNENLIFGSKIKNMWLSPDITDTQKAHIWLYFHKLIKAGGKIVN